MRIFLEAIAVGFLFALLGVVILATAFLLVYVASYIGGTKGLVAAFVLLLFIGGVTARLWDSI